MFQDPYSRADNLGLLRGGMAFRVTHAATEDIDERQVSRIVFEGQPMLPIA